MKSLLLSNYSKPATVDDDIYEQVQGKSWRLIKVSNGAQYIGWKTHKNGKDVTIYLHRLVMGFPAAMVDHISGDIYDCQRSNLRIVTNSQNQMNSRGQSRTSAYKNVYWDKKRQKWKAQVTVDGQIFFLGYFKEERHAAYAVDLNLPILHGEYARPNFPDAIVSIAD